MTNDSRHVQPRCWAEGRTVVPISEMLLWPNTKASCSLQSRTTPCVPTWVGDNLYNPLCRLSIPYNSECPPDHYYPPWNFLSLSELLANREWLRGLGLQLSWWSTLSMQWALGLIIQHCISYAWMSTPVILVLGRGRQENRKFKVILSYVTSLWSAWAIYGSVSKTRNIVIASLVATDAELYRGVCCMCT